MDFHILGPLEVRRDGDRLALGGPKQRALLAILLLNANRVVSRDRLIEELWADRPPAAARRALEVQISRLRKALGADGSESSVLLTRVPGYVLRVEPGALDLQRFERLLAQGRRALADGDPAGAASVLREAEGLWRGRPLADLEFEPFARVDIERLEELRLVALEERIEAELVLGRHVDLIAELEALVAEHPLRERLRGQLMLALYRCDRQAEALEVYRHGRRRLVEELALEPSPTLQRLQQAIMTQDAELAAPPPTATAVRERGLPVLPNRTIGRAAELRAICQRLRAPSVRLLTLTGPGGVGKTRLAIESAHTAEMDFADGARLVSLDALLRSEDVPAALVAALGIVTLPGESADQAARRFLGAAQLLLVADNFEHLLPGAAPFLAGLLEACPALTVLATSREPLGIHAEERYPVAPLALPPPGTPEDLVELAEVDAVALFCERARAHDPDFALGETTAVAIAEICRRLDGLPLAIELAAARCALLSAAEIAERLGSELPALGAGARDAPARQRTLRATIDWSYNLLDHAEKRCFARFAAFAGGATLEAAETITGVDLDLLDRLVAKSLLVSRRNADARTRLSMLETIRSHATEHLAGADDEQAVRERHHGYFLALAERHGNDRALWGASSKEHLVALDAEVPNLHAALAWAVDRDRTESALALCAALGRYWLMRYRYGDALEWVDRALSLPGADAVPALRVHALCIKGWAVWPLGHVADQAVVMDEAEAIARALAEPAILSRTLQSRALHATSANRIDVSRGYAEEALHWAHVAGDDLAMAQAAFSHALAATSAAELRDRVQRAASLLEAVGDVYHLAILFSSAGYLALANGSDRDANDFVERAIPIAREHDNPYGWMLLQGNLALAKLLTGDADVAHEAFCEELRLCRELGVLPLASEPLFGLAAVAAVRHDHARAARLVGAAGAHAYDVKHDKVEARLDAAFLYPARRRHGASDWGAAESHGAALSLEDAIAYALEEPR
jgi:predicted ATPase/DNA-binding SARP family transcriptional activator